MGVGFPLDLVVCACLGVDMCDCVYPTRTARFGTALTWGPETVLSADKPPGDSGACVLRLKSAGNSSDLRNAHSWVANLWYLNMAMDCAGAVDPSCDCAVCKTYTRAYLHQLFCARSEVAATLLSYHNVYYMMRLMRTLRESIIDGTLPDFVRAFMQRMYPDGQYPQWAAEALQSQGISLR